MSETHTGGCACGTTRRGRGESAALGAARCLNLAAAPAFTIMALLTAGGPADILCSTALEGLPLGGMTHMYLLMSIFHAPPWLRLIARQARRRR